MKLITAIIRESRLDQVREALIAAEIERITVGRVSGHGRQETQEVHRGKRIIPELIPKVRIDVAVNDEFVDVTVQTIIQAARQGAVGDGKILITPMEECIRIRTGERGAQAI